MALCGAIETSGRFPGINNIDVSRTADRRLSMIKILGDRPTTSMTPAKRKTAATKRSKPATKAAKAPAEKPPVGGAPTGQKGPTIGNSDLEGHVSPKGAVRVWVAIPEEHREEIMDRKKFGPTFGGWVRRVAGERPSKAVPQSEYAGPWKRVAVYLPKDEAEALVAWEKDSGQDFDLYLAARLLEELGK